MPKKFVRITHIPSGMNLAEGPIGWGITPFEGNLYIRRKYLLTDGFKPNLIPGFCSYKFLYVWLDLELDKKKVARSLGWVYWLPNPLFPFIWYRVGLPMSHPELRLEEFVPDQVLAGREPLASEGIESQALKCRTHGLSPEGGSEDAYQEEECGLKSTIHPIS